jgi:dihydroxyacid dehydratase/phosphogluconate dehydratase
MITFDIPQRTLSVELTDAEIQHRRAAWQPPLPRYVNGVMAKYALLVSSSSLGAITAVSKTSSSQSSHPAPATPIARTL